ncbi:MAG: DsrH/TusB family sulfur metabolism protein [Pseudomonadota bacterium]|nr:DsrH/TusB family sulfur metabolism protein [Pseudomonadota bacterium]
MSLASEIGALHLVVGQRDLALPKLLLLTLAPGDSVILLQEAVWLALATAFEPDLWSWLPNTCCLFVLRADLEVRGLADRNLHARVQAVDDPAWVEASERHARCITWSHG